ncbi:low-density lipoprotein receptor-related protein 4-like [Anneissia japonica]|uniref:low-density lipoprotein receptor-related protein 4-like n=1 Tax=Anneissia japonica TaxID=1529436 RepID=UPI00142568F2|nr:low-density lipoprotein receptor-related protein 4-like [Anneissia japonica]
MSWFPWLGLMLVLTTTALRLGTKDGACPIPKGFGICVNVCTSDYDCTGSLKCCSNGCGRSCMEALGLIEQGIDTDPLIIFADRYTVREYDPIKKEYRTIADNQKNAVALDYDFKEMQIYWSDVSLDQIYRTNIDGTGVPEVLITGASIPDGISIDWVYRNIYWTDTGTNAIEVANLKDTSKRTILISDNLDEPRAITIEPRLGYMFWTDWGQAAKIERAGMNGEARVTLVDTDINWPNGLTTDLVSNLLFWVDGQRHSLSSIDYNGQGRRTIIQSSSILPHPFAITVFGDYVYWTDWRKRAISKANKFTGKHTILVENLSRPTGIQIYHPQKQIDGIINYCERNNGGCSYLCVASPKRGDKSAKYSCLCPTNSFLMQDGRTCAGSTRNPPTSPPATIGIDTDPLIIFADRYTVREYDPIKKEYRTIADNQKNAVALDYDFKEMQIYWSDVSLDQIYRTNIDGTGVPEVLITGASIPDGISIDWVYRNIYWTDTGTNAIEVANLKDTSKRTILISDNLDEPRAITIEPRLGYMFWTDWGQAAKIERAGMNGEARVTLVDTDINWPNGLTTDLVSNLLFWVDGQRHSLSSIDYNGHGRRTIIQSSSILPHPFAITVFGDYVYWTDWQKRAIIKANKFTGKHTILVENLSRPTGIQIYHPQKQIDGITNYCGRNNGGCSYLCVASPKRGDKSVKYSCLCPTNSFLMQDGRTCEGSTRNPPTPPPATIDLSPCHPNPCVNGVCIYNIFTKLFYGGYLCKCDSGYSGKHCE